MRQQRAQEFLGISRSIETFERERLVVSHLVEFLYAHFFKIAFVVGSTLPPLTRGSIVAQALKGCAQPEIDVAVIVQYMLCFSEVFGGIQRSLEKVPRTGRVAP